VLQRVVLRLREHVQAEHGLEQRRVAERHYAVLMLAELEANRDETNLVRRRSTRQAD